MQKFSTYRRFSVVGVLPFQSFQGSYGCVGIVLSVAVANGFIARKVLDVRNECARLRKKREGLKM